MDSKDLYLKSQAEWFRIQFFIFNTSDSVGVFLLNETCLFVCLAIFLELGAHVHRIIFCMRIEIEQHLYMILVIYRRLTDRQTYMLFHCYSFCANNSLFKMCLLWFLVAIQLPITDHLPWKSNFEQKEFKVHVIKFTIYFKFIWIANDPTSSTRQDRRHTQCVMSNGDVNTIRLQNLFWNLIWIVTRMPSFLMPMFFLVSI